jgi:hypothetical protein
VPLPKELGVPQLPCLSCLERFSCLGWLGRLPSLGRLIRLSSHIMPQPARRALTPRPARQAPMPRPACQPLMPRPARQAPMPQPARPAPTPQPVHQARPSGTLGGAPRGGGYCHACARSPSLLLEGARWPIITHACHHRYVHQHFMGLTWTLLLY